MARSRNIKPGFFLNEKLAELKPIVRLLFIGLWTLSDRDGKLENRPKRIKAELFPYDTIDIDKSLDMLEQKKFILRYGQNKCYIQVVNFSKHQNPHKNEKPSNIENPPISENDVETMGCETLEKLREDSGTSTRVAPELHPSTRADSLLLIPDSQITCAEQNKFCSPPEDSFKISLMLNDKSLYGITNEQIAKWSEIYPAVLVYNELQRMQEWLENNPAKRKTDRGIKNFITRWLKKSQDQGGRR